MRACMRRNGRLPQPFFITFVFLVLSSIPVGRSAPADSTAKDSLALHESRAAPEAAAVARDNTTSVEPLPDHYWELAGSADDVEAFRQKYDLIIVDYTPQDAALMPSWPQALVQYVLVAPPINCWVSSSHTRHWSTNSNGIETSYGSETSGWKITPFNIFQVVFFPLSAIGWIVSFGITESAPESGGWMSVLGWAMWVDLRSMFLGPVAIPFFLFQWFASLALVIQRWKSGLGDVAYQIDDLHGCTPVDGNAYLQQGARSYTFKVLQAVTFSVSTLFLVLSGGEPESFNGLIALPALGELIYTAWVASKGTPMVVSGNCLLVELDPRNGFLDSSISTRWKVFASFMGF